MQIIIVEDELPAVEKLTRLVARYDRSIEIIGQFDEVETTVSWLKENPSPDLLFLDIHLADGLSFEIFDQVQVSCPIIFTTAFDQYAIQAFKVNSVDYLLKPIKYIDLKNALDKFKELHPADRTSTVDLQLLSELIHRKRTVYKSRFLIRAGNVIKTIATEDIAYFISEDKITFLVTDHGKRYPIDHTLDELEEMIDPEIYRRVNRQFIVSVRSIEEIRPYFKGRVKLILKPKQDVDLVVSSEKTRDFKKWLGQ